MRILLFNSVLALFCITVGCGPSLNAVQASSMPEQEEGGSEVPSPQPLPAKNLSSPELDPNFNIFMDGKALSTIKVSGSSLTIARGSGDTFSTQEQERYQRLKEASKTDPGYQIYWAMMDLDQHKMMDQSLTAHQRIFGASSSKVYVAATLLDLSKGDLSNSLLEEMADMLVISSNEAWTSLQREIGDGSADLGRERNYAFTQKMGYPETRGFQGYWGEIHGNELVASEAVELLYDTYTMQYPGAEYLWKIMYTCRTGLSRGRKYIPESISVGGKTGTYDGPTENPETGEQYQVRIRNHLIIVNIKGRQYGLAVFANTGSDEDVAVLVGGLLREYAGLED